MTTADWLGLAVTLTALVVLFYVANTLDSKDDDDGYNTERGDLDDES